jgi:hypothetical protein
LGFEKSELGFAADKDAYKMAKLFAYQGITANEIVERSGLCRDSVMRALEGRCGISKKVQKIFSKLTTEQNAFIVSEEAAWKLRLTRLLPEEEAEKETVSAEIADSCHQVPAPEMATEKHKTLVILAGMVKAALPLAELVLTDEFSADDRAELRKLCGGDGVFRLSNRLSNLCGETARNGSTTTNKDS